MNLSSRGSALFETLSTLTVLILIMSAGLYITTLFAVKNWVHFSLYEGAICVFEEKPHRECEARYRTRVEMLLPFVNVQDVRFRKFLTFLHAKTTVHVAGQKQISYSFQMVDPAQEKK